MVSVHGQQRFNRASSRFSCSQHPCASPARLRGVAQEGEQALSWQRILSYRDIQKSSPADGAHSALALLQTCHRAASSLGPNATRLCWIRRSGGNSLGSAPQGPGAAAGAAAARPPAPGHREGQRLLLPCGQHPPPGAGLGPPQFPPAWSHPRRPGHHHPQRAVPARPVPRFAPISRTSLLPPALAPHPSIAKFKKEHRRDGGRLPKTPRPCLAPQCRQVKVCTQLRRLREAWRAKS